MQIRTSSVLQIRKNQWTLHNLLIVLLRIEWQCNLIVMHSGVSQGESKWILRSRSVCVLFADCVCQSPDNEMLWELVQIFGLVKRKQWFEPMWWLSYSWDSSQGHCYLTAISYTATDCVPISLAEENAGPNLPVADRLNEKWEDYRTMSSVLIFTCTYAPVLSVGLIQSWWGTTALSLKTTPNANHRTVF